MVINPDSAFNGGYFKVFHLGILCPQRLSSSATVIPADS